MRRTFQRVAIVNRGEAAMRFVHALRELSTEGGARLRSIALVTRPDRFALFAREADEVFDLGDPSFVDPRDGRRKSAYLDQARVMRALEAVHADAVWVGWGFVAEDPSFADLCASKDIVSIGPDGDGMRLLGDKVAAKHLAERLDIPTIPWSGPLDSIEHARAAIARIGLPVLLKAAAGGGGRGIRRLLRAEEIDLAFESAHAEALAAFGDGSLFIEKLLVGLRHVEVQVIADHYGTTWAIGVRDCSLQRRHQKILEEAPCPALDPESERALRDAAVRLARAAGYRNAGTVEFLFDPSSRRFYLLEVNARLQVEHPVTEVTTGLDLVKMQIRIARGERLEGEPPATTGHAIEVRLNAEDPDSGFAPAPGTFARLRLPTGPGIRVDRGVTEGDAVPPDFDSMFAKVIASGRTRSEALARMHRALSDSVMLLDTGTTNRSFLLELLDEPAVRSGEVDIGWLERWMAQGADRQRPHAALALVLAAVEAYQGELALERREFYVSAARMRAEIREEIGRTFALRHGGSSYSVEVFRLSPGRFRAEVDGHRVELAVDPVGPHERWVTIGEQRHRVACITQGVGTRIDVDGHSHRISRDDGGVIRAGMPAVVSSIAVSPGDRVPAGARLAVIEAMKMESEITAPTAGLVREVFVVAGAQVGPGAPLVELVPEDRRDSLPGAVRLDPSGVAAPPGPEDAGAAWLAVVRELRQLVLGYDLSDDEARRLSREYTRLAAVAPTPGPEHVTAENELLAIFADVESLFRPRRDDDDDTIPEEHRASEYLLQFMRTWNKSRARLPRSFMERLEHALAHWGVVGLDPSAALEDGLLCLYKAHRRAAIVPALALVLERRLSEPRPASVRPEDRELLDRIATVTQIRHPALADLARELRQRDFDLPLLEQRRREVYAEVDRHAETLVQHATAPEATAAFQALVTCPLPLQKRLGAPFRRAGRLARERFLEVMTRRYYRIRDIAGVTTETIGDQGLAHAEFDHEGHRFHVVATHAFRAVAEALEALRAARAAIPPDRRLLGEVFVWRDGPPGTPDDNAASLAEALTGSHLVPAPHRVCFALAGSGDRSQTFTFRPAADGGWKEDRALRGMHPMLAKRLQLWRLSNFEIERLASAEGVFLFRAVARGNPKDERLFCFCEVRDLVPTLGADGEVTALPEVELVLWEALAAIRHVQAHRPSHCRLQGNRVIVNVEPPLDLGAREIRAIALKLRPAAQSIGLEKVVVRAAVPDPATGLPKDTVLTIHNPHDGEVTITSSEPSERPIRTMSEYDQKVHLMRQRGLVYPYEIVSLLSSGAHDLPPGSFLEHDLDDAGALVPVHRPPGHNVANVVVGVIRNDTARHPEGMRRVILLGDPSREMGSLAEPECRRILGALDLARALNVPLEWFALSAGAKISMQSGVENMDWISRVLRGVVAFTQEGRELNVVVTGITVGAQPYWNAEATMLMHTRGILIMTAEGAMVLTGKTALDYSGSVSAEDNFGIGGYDQIMGPNGQAQYFARDVTDACRLLLRHYDHTYLAAGERFPRRVPTSDPPDRDVSAFPHGGAFDTVGQIFSDEHNPGRKKPFEIRKVMRAVTDQDQAPLERWRDMREAEMAVVWDAHVGGRPVCLIGIESHPVARMGAVPNDGPEAWTSGTLFPLSSKKVARALNAASGNRPAVILANLSGFDGSPESMRRLQLEYGAEIGRAIVNFRGPIVFAVVSRYHGGAFVVFSKVLQDEMESVALEGSYASVIGGAPAAAVVFARDVSQRVARDPRIARLTAAIVTAPETERRALRAELDALSREVQAEKIGEVADEFDTIHSVERARKVGALDQILAPASLRPYLIDAVERGIARALAPGPLADQRRRAPASPEGAL